MNRSTTLALAQSLAMLLAVACARPGAGGTPTAPAANGDLADPPAPTPAASGTPAGRAPDATSPSRPADAPSEVRASVGDRYDPAISATEAGWLVGWTEAAGGRGRVAVAFVAADAATPELLGATTVLAEGEVAGLRLAGALAVWVEGAGEERRVMARRLGARGEVDAARPATALATGPKLGNPEAVAIGDEVVVAWTDGPRAHAVKLGDTGVVVARADWWGGNARPESHFRPDDAPPDPDPERSEASRDRPWILRPAADAPIEVRWEADWWLSDDQGGTVTARHVVTWGEKTGDAEETERPGGVWSWIADLDSASALAAQQEHDPNGGPWILRLLGLGPEPIEVASGPAGPYVVDVTSRPGPVVAFYDAATSRYRVVRLGDGGARREVGLPTAAPFGEAAVAVAGEADGDALGVAYTTVADGRLTVRLAVLGAEAEGDREGPRLVRPEATPIAVGARFAPSHMDAVHLDGRTLLTWQDYWDWRIRAVWLKEGAAEGRPLELSAGSPRSEGGAVAALPEGGAAVAFQSCSGSSICGDTTLRVLKLAPGAEPSPLDLGQRPNDRHPRLCVGPMGPVLAVQRGNYGSVSVVWGPSGDRHTVDVPTPDRNNGGFPQGLSCGEGGIFVVMTSFGRSHDTGRVDLIAISEAGATTRETLETPGSLWSFHALVDDGARVGLVTNLATPTGANVALRWYPTAGGAPTVDVLQRNLRMWSPHAVTTGASPERRFAAAWYDRASDAVYAVLTAPDGRRLAGPVRLDDPAARESQNAPIVVREGDTWAAYWQERDALYRARPF